MEYTSEKWWCIYNPFHLFYVNLIKYQNVSLRNLQSPYQRHLPYDHLITISSGFNVIRQRQLSWRLRWPKLRTQSLRPSSSYHNWMENTHGGTHRLFDIQYECAYLCIGVRVSTHLLRKGLIYHGRATGGVREREGDRQGDVSCCLESLLAVFAPLQHLSAP